jgi:hypothetical protein
VTAIGVFIQFLEPGYNTRTYGIKVYITDQLLQVCLFLTDNGFISILKKPAVAFVAVVEAHGVSREKPSHQGGKGDESGSG